MILHSEARTERAGQKQHKNCRTDDNILSVGEYRWQQNEGLHHSALERPIAERAAFIAQACAGGLDLRREVESLLVHEGHADHLLEHPAWAHLPSASGPKTPPE